MTSLYLALAQAAPAASPQQSIWSTLSLMAILFLIFYFLLIRPQQKQLQAQKNLIASLQRGDAVITSSGIHGKVVEVKETVLILEIASQVKITVERDAVTRTLKADAKPEADKTEKADKK